MNNRTATIFVCAALAVLLAGAPVFSAGGPGLYELSLWADENGDIGVVSIWNSPQNLHIKMIPNEEWRIVDTQIYVGLEVDGYPILTKKKGRSFPASFLSRGIMTRRQKCTMRLLI